MLNRLIPVSVLLLPLSGVQAHHSQGSYYDTSITIEIEGVLLEARCQNPHMRFVVQSVNADGQEVTWDVEATSLSLIRMLGTERGFIEEGDRVKMAGSPARRSPTGMYALNILAPDGLEILLSGGAQPRWTTPDVNSKADLANATAQAVDADDDAGIFRTWSTVLGPTSNRLWEDEYPLTEWASGELASWDPVADNPTLRCEPKGMPTIMDAPYPVELVDQGTTMLIKQEEFDTVRIIYMEETHADREISPNIYGHSVGRWDADTLIIETIGSNWPFYDNDGVPQTVDTEYVERFWLNEGGTSLEYTLTAIDSTIFTETVTLDRSWIWRPDVTIQPFNCTL